MLEGNFEKVNYVYVKLCYILISMLTPAGTDERGEEFACKRSGQAWTTYESQCLLQLEAPGELMNQWFFRLEK